MSDDELLVTCDGCEGEFDQSDLNEEGLCEECADEEMDEEND